MSAYLEDAQHHQELLALGVAHADAVLEKVEERGRHHKKPSGPQPQYHFVALEFYGRVEKVVPRPCPGRRPYLVVETGDAGVAKVVKQVDDTF